MSNHLFQKKKNLDVYYFWPSSLNLIKMYRLFTFHLLKLIFTSNLPKKPSREWRLLWLHLSGYIMYVVTFFVMEIFDFE